ncbi:MAG: DUF6268 family outer membrane beta-barrel protein [Bacteroidota bacterium]
MTRSFLIFLITLSAYGQMPNTSGDGVVELGGFNYSYIPDLGGTEITNYGINANLGRPVGKGIIALALGYQQFDFSFGETFELLDLSTYEQMHVVRTNVSYLRPLKNSWGLLISGGTSLMSNFGNGISSEDFVFNAIVGFTKRWGNPQKNSTLLLGISYGTQFGEPIIFPAISFRKKLNEHWNYSLGIPVTGINYQINDKHRLSLLVSAQGLFANNSNEVITGQNQALTNTKLQFNGVNTRLSYQFIFAKNLAFFAEAGFVPLATLKVLDDANEELLDLDPGSSAYINTGLRFIINKKP